MTWDKVIPQSLSNSETYHWCKYCYSSGDLSVPNIFRKMSVCEYNQEIIKNYEEQDIDIRLCKQFGDNLPVVNDLTALIRELNQAFSSDYVNIDLVSYLMKSYKSHPTDWKKYAKFDRYRWALIFFKYYFGVKKERNHNLCYIWYH